jgi:hypothetical protein
MGSSASDMRKRLRRILRLPHVRQELVELAHWRGGDFGQNAAEVGVRVEAVALGAGDQRVESRVAFARVVMAGEKPVLSSDRDTLERTLGGVVVDVQVALLDVTAQRFLLVQGVGDRLAHRTSWPGAQTARQC